MIVLQKAPASNKRQFGVEAQLAQPLMNAVATIERRPQFIVAVVWLLFTMAPDPEHHFLGKIIYITYIHIRERKSSRNYLTTGFL